MTTHELKTWPEPFAAVLDGSKTYEVRRADRPFKVGDRLLLREWVQYGDEERYAFPYVGRYTGRSLLVEVTYLSAGGTWGLPADLCVMSIRKVGTGIANAEHEFVGDGCDCELCGEGSRHYLHSPEPYDGPADNPPLTAGDISLAVARSHSRTP